MWDFPGAGSQTPTNASQLYVPDPDGARGPGDHWTHDFLTYARTGHTALRLDNAGGRVLVVGGGSGPMRGLPTSPGALARRGLPAAEKALAG